MKYIRHSGLIAFTALMGCGTTYVVPAAQETDTVTAAKMFEEARADSSHPVLSTSSAERRFQRVAERIEVAGKTICETETATQPDFDCNVNIDIDREMDQRNAYFTYIGDTPTIRISLPLIKDTESDDEVAFVLSHEYGHLIGRHIEKQQQQAMAGALIMGALTAYSHAQAEAGGYYYDPDDMYRNVQLGAAAGAMAYSQTYELESDTLGTYIATAAGYDPVKGAGYFARPEDAQTTAGNLSFWGTHPPDQKRLATVLATVRMLETQGGLALANHSTN